MKLTQSFISAALFSALSFGASTTAVVTTMGGESVAPCSETHNDGSTSSCSVNYSDGRGSALSSMYQYAPTGFVWFGSLQRTQTASTINIMSKASVAFSTEFATANASGHGVNITYNATSNDLEGVDVYAKDASGDYQVIRRLAGGGDSINVAYSGYPIDIILVASISGLGVIDYASLFHVDLSQY